MGLGEQTPFDYLGRFLSGENTDFTLRHEHDSSIPRPTRLPSLTRADGPSVCRRASTGSSAGCKAQRSDSADREQRCSIRGSASSRFFAPCSSGKTQKCACQNSEKVAKKSATPIQENLRGYGFWGILQNDDGAEALLTVSKTAFPAASRRPRCAWS